MIETQIIDLFKDGAYFPNKHHIKRIQKYKTNELLFKGKHYDAFEGHNALTKSQKNLLQVSVNLPSLICKKSADFLFGEQVKVLSGKGDDTLEQKAFDRIVQNNNLNILTYESALSNAYYGDAFIKVRFGQEFGGMLPKDLDAPRIFIENVNPCMVYPQTFEYDKSKIMAYHIAMPIEVVEDSGDYILNVESHFPNLILYTKYKITPAFYDRLGNIERFKIECEIENERHYVKTGVPMPLVVHIPNTGLVGEWAGVDDLTEHYAIFDEINNRLAQISDILDKHSDPAMAVPTGILDADEDGNTHFAVSHNKVFELLGKDDILPQYITWDGQLQNAFTELDKLIDLLLTTAEIPSVALGRDGSGTSGSSGLAIKWRMNTLLSKINRKRQYYDKGLKQVMMLAQLLETNLGVDAYRVTLPVLQFQDGLPQDDMELANMMAVRTGGAKTLSQKSAIIYLNDYTEEQAEKEIERIKEEEEQQMAQVDTDYNNIEPAENENISFDADNLNEVV